MRAVPTVLAYFALLTAGCVPLAPEPPEELAAAIAKARSEPYPELRDVPQRRPFLDTPQQRRRLAARLRRARERARYEGELLRFRLGQRATPPEPPRAPPAPQAVAPMPPPPPLIEEEPLRTRTRGELEDLLDWLRQRYSEPDPAPGAPAADGVRARCATREQALVERPARGQIESHPARSGPGRP